MTAPTSAAQLPDPTAPGLNDAQREARRHNRRAAAVGHALSPQGAAERRASAQARHEQLTADVLADLKARAR